MTRKQILIVDDERNIRRSLEMILEGEGYEVQCAGSGKEALKLVADEAIEAVVLDIVMPGMNGIDVLQQMRKLREDIAVIIISGHGTVQNAVSAIKLGAYDFLEKPLSREKVLLTVARAVEASELTAENRTLRLKIESRYQMVGSSDAMESVRQQIDRVAPTNGRVLILGESGTGKELVARDIHNKSQRQKGAFVKVNCAAIPEELIESELFGSDRGAFTGAVKSRDGKFLAADGGTLFLDEIGDMSLNVQAKVLRALEQGEFERVGGNETIRVDVRVLAATNKDLQNEVDEGRFREDLFFRLNVIPITAPPLRSRRDDIPLLVSHFIAIYAEENGTAVKGVPPDTMEALRSYAWPGNIRELRNLVERLCIMVPEDTIRPQDLDLKDSSRAEPVLPGVPEGKTLREVRELVERNYIIGALERCGWNVTQAARDLGIERTNLHKKIKAYELERQAGGRIN